MNALRVSLSSAMWLVTATLVSVCAWGASSEAEKRLGELSLEELGNVEVTTASRSPEQAWKLRQPFTSLHKMTSSALELPRFLRRYDLRPEWKSNASTAISGPSASEALAAASRAMCWW
jgi:hypothetical protein